MLVSRGRISARADRLSEHRAHDLAVSLEFKAEIRPRYLRVGGADKLVTPVGGDPGECDLLVEIALMAQTDGIVHREAAEFPPMPPPRRQEVTGEARRL